MNRQWPGQCAGGNVKVLLMNSRGEKVSESVLLALPQGSGENRFETTVTVWVAPVQLRADETILTSLPEGTVVGVAFSLTTTMSPGAQVNAAADVALTTAPNGAARTPSNSPRVTIPRSIPTPSAVDLPARIRRRGLVPLVAAWGR